MSAPSSTKDMLFIGLMSGTSLDGVDGVLTSFSAEYGSGPINTLATAYLSFPAPLRTELLTLQTASDNEIHREALAANALAQLYAECTALLLEQANVSRDQICAIGVHGQTIRHRPNFGYSRQTNNPALLAELSGIDVIADFRSRDIAAGGQGAPLVPAFHQAVFAQQGTVRVVANIGGMSNISILDHRLEMPKITGFDTGPGNVLLDAWAATHLGKSYDENGNWAANGAVIPALLKTLRDEPFLKLPPPKSTGRDLFRPDWLQVMLKSFQDEKPEDVQATLVEYTATTLADAVADYADAAESIHICGGGAYNAYLMQRFSLALASRNLKVKVAATTALGILPNHVEALAFAWLAYRFTMRQPGNLSAVTGAKGPRILGALYPA
jgi:anhydro-N-acetylmuramic acid kinase